jgi:bleomycin hydrolase
MLLYFKKCLILLFACLLIAMVGYTQAVHPGLTPVSKSEHTSVKNQANTGTCWSFSMVSLIESQSLKNGLGQFDLSEMFIVRNIYVEKAKNYVFRQGAAQFVLYLKTCIRGLRLARLMIILNWMKR